MKYLNLTFLLLLTTVGLSQAQSGSSNITTFTPSALLRQGQYEIQSFNNLYSQNAVRNAAGDRVDLNQRQLFLNSMLMFTYGVSPQAKFNVGLDVNINRARYTTTNSNALGIFGSTDGDYTRTVISSIAPRIKFNPISSIPRFSLQSSLSIPIANNLETPRFVAHDRFNWWTQLYYDKSFGTHWQVFFELDLLYRLKNQEFQQNFFRTPASVFVSYFPSSRFTVYTNFQHSPAFGRVTSAEESQFGQLRWFSQWGVGSKYQLTNRLGIELSYSNFFASRNDGAGQTINLGLRFIK